MAPPKAKAAAPPAKKAKAEPVKKAPPPKVVDEDDGEARSFFSYWSVARK